MLAKIWKKLLFAICIIACLFNIVSKLVNKTSLEIQLNSVKDGNSLSDIFNIESSENTIINTSINTDEYSNEIQNTNTAENTSNIISDFVVEY